MTHPIDPTKPRDGWLITGYKRNGSKVVRYAYSLDEADAAWREMRFSGKYEYVGSQRIK